MPAPKPPSRKPAPKPPALEPGPGDATLIYDRNKDRPRLPTEDAPRLLVTAGPRKGMEHPLVEERTTIGRGEGNVLVIPDISVSRQHSRLEKQAGRWILHDQGSGNGTRVNGKPVDRYPLQHGDEIEMGDTKLKFVEPGGVLVKGARAPAARPAEPGVPEITGKDAPARGSLKKRAPLYFAIVGGLAIVFAAGLVKKRRQEAADAAAAAQGRENREFAQLRFQEGVALLKQGKWIEARDKLQIAAEMDAQDPEIARYLESAENEAPRAQQIAAARAALQRRDYAGARAALEGVPDDSALAEAAHELSREIGVALDAAVRDARMRAESGDAAAAQELLDPVLAAEPSRADALAVKGALAGQKHAAPEPERKKERPRPAPATAPAAAPDAQGILEAYLAGDIGAALDRAGRSTSPRGQRLLEDLKAFDAAYKEGLAKQQAKRPAEALRALDRAAAADRSIAQGREGRLGREVHKLVSALHTELGAAAAGADETLPQAAAHLRAAVQNDPENDSAQAGLRQIGDRCKEIYLRGYVGKDDDPEEARKAFKLVIATLPPADETAQKAKHWLDKLDGKVAKDE